MIDPHGSESDRERVEKALPILHGAGVEVGVSSAHRDPERTVELAGNAEARGFDVISRGAGSCAALPGVVAAHTRLPVIGVPLSADTLGGLDTLLSIAQMPPGCRCRASGSTTPETPRAGAGHPAGPGGVEGGPRRGASR